MADPQTTECWQVAGHAGWLDCPTHNREVMAKLGRHVNPTCGHELHPESPEAKLAQARAEIARLREELERWKAIDLGKIDAIGDLQADRDRWKLAHDTCCDGGQKTLAALAQQTRRAELAERAIHREHFRTNGMEALVGRTDDQHERSIMRCQHHLCVALKASHPAYDQARGQEAKG